MSTQRTSYNDRPKIAAKSLSTPSLKGSIQTLESDQSSCKEDMGSQLLRLHIVNDTSHVLYLLFLAFFWAQQTSKSSQTCPWHLLGSSTQPIWLILFLCFMPSSDLSSVVSSVHKLGTGSSNRKPHGASISTARAGIFPPGKA